jgi:hypothetical protein
MEMLINANRRWPHGPGVCNDSSSDVINEDGAVSKSGITWCAGYDRLLNPSKEYNDY